MVFMSFQRCLEDPYQCWEASEQRQARGEAHERLRKVALLVLGDSTGGMALNEFMDSFKQLHPTVRGSG